jgi:hypothetical protein
MFFGALVLATAIPLFGLGFAVPLAAPAGARFPYLLASLFPIVAATSLGHVAATAFLYVDREFWPLMRANMPRFFVWPLLAVAVSLGAYLINPLASLLFNVLFAAWQMHHYQRQTYGLVAFAAQNRKMGPLPDGIRWMLDLGTAGGVLGSFANLGLNSASGGQHQELLAGLRFCSVACFLASSALLVQVLLKHRRLWSDPLLITFIAMGWAFFLPVLMSRDILVSIQSFSIAHGAQYLIFLTTLSAGSAYRWAGPAVMAVVTLATWKMFTVLNATAAGTAIYIGLVAGHFMIDAKVWRMRDPLQRSLVKLRFAFLFA